MSSLLYAGKTSRGRGGEAEGGRSMTFGRAELNTLASSVWAGRLSWTYHFTSVSPSFFGHSESSTDPSSDPSPSARRGICSSTFERIARWTDVLIDTCDEMSSFGWNLRTMHTSQRVCTRILLLKGMHAYFLNMFGRLGVRVGVGWLVGGELDGLESFGELVSSDANRIRTHPAPCLVLSILSWDDWLKRRGSSLRYVHVSRGS